MAHDSKKLVTIQDFQPFLRKCLNCRQLEILDLEETNLVPLGDNFGSLMLRLDVTVRRTKDAKKEILNLVAKTPSLADRHVVHWPEIFKKEVFIYTDLAPMYDEIEREMNIEPTLNILPKYIGHRNSLNDDAGKIDQYSMLLMENLKSQGFYNCDKLSGMNAEHAGAALTSLARYHSLGIALRHKRPDFFKIALAKAQVLNFDFGPFYESLDGVLKTIRETSFCKKHLSVIEESFANAKNGELYGWNLGEPWITIAHGDCWCNNILFHKNEQGQVDDVKFVDFQTYLYSSPQKDVGHLICNNLDTETRVNHIDKLIDLYYETFTKSLERLGCNSKPFDKESFDRGLKQQVVHDFPLYSLVAKFLAFEIKVESNQDNGLLTEIFKSQSNEGHIKRLQVLIELFETKGWF